ncbi:dienelactone hydrolase family protein [Marinibaculum pumilum]|uniref:Dienelactone hydrolase family protein n=1 Tax=Marinibaculum pumilum TaxID=1766165 RepID=A0ABV7L196_9PROT
MNGPAEAALPGMPAERSVILEGTEVRPRRVLFPSSDPFLLKDVAAAADSPRQTVGHLFLPDGELRNRPAVVVVQGLGGQKPERELTYGAKLARAGYLALVLDSFGARDREDQRDILKALTTTTWAILADLFGALRFLAAEPAVNPSAIGTMGFSWGGMASVLAAYDQIRRTYLEADGLRFASHVSYYGCSLPRLEDPAAGGADLLVLAGAADANVSVERTRRICQDLERGGARVTLEVLDAFHQWDGKDVERRHVFGALSDIGITVTRDNRLLSEGWNAEITDWLSRTLFAVLDLGWAGYEIQRDPDLHRRTDGMMLAHFQRMALRGGAQPPDPARVPAGALGTAPD